jgi:hypothetical protein
MKKISIRRRARLSVGIIATFIAGGMMVPSVANADPAPFKDPNAVGLIGFCDKNNNPVVSGHVRDVPFVSKYVSDTSAPKNYAGRFQRAAIYAFSPIPYTNPGDWSGYQMTAGSLYTNLKTPMAAATFGDPPLEWQLQSFPAHMDGLVQMRMILTNVNTPPRTNEYAQAIIRVKGDSWTLVTGVSNKALCQAGLAQSAEVVRLPASKVPSAPPTWAANAPASQTQPMESQSPSSKTLAPAPLASTTSSTASEGASPNVSGVMSTDSSSQASSSQPTSSGLGALPLILGLAALLVGAGAFIVGRRSAANRPTDPPV